MPMDIGMMTTLAGNHPLPHLMARNGFHPIMDMIYFWVIMLSRGVVGDFLEMSSSGDEP
jgi:hypothetical protein